MAYDDELGAVLNKLHRNDLSTLATECLRRPSERVDGFSVEELRLYCSKHLRKAGGHSLVNQFREPHELDYAVIVRDASKVLGVKKDDDDDVLMLERKILSKTVQRAVQRLDDDEWASFKDEMVKQVRDKQLKDAFRTLTRADTLTVLKVLATNPKAFGSFSVASSALVVGPVVASIASVVGWNMLQAIVIQSLISTIGYYAALKAALGLGFWGGVVAVAGYATPITACLATAYGAHKAADVAYRLTVPSVLFIATKRLQLFS